MASHAEFFEDLEIAEKLHNAVLIDEKSKTVKMILAGPRNTAYQDGTFEVEISFGDDYPVSKPTAMFTCKVWNPAVDPRTSQIFFENTPYNVTTAIEFVMELLTTSISNKYDETARFWTQRYADYAGPDEQDAQWLANISFLGGMGFMEDESVLALSLHDGNMELALEELCEMSLREEVPVYPEGPMAHGEAGPSGLRAKESDDDSEEDSGAEELGWKKVGPSEKPGPSKK